MIIEKISKNRSIVIKSNTNIEKVITKLNAQEIKFLLVVYAQKLEGTLTDSDLRRKGVFKKKMILLNQFIIQNQNMFF